MSHRVRFASEAADQLEELHAYISVAATPTIASDYLDAIVDPCEGLAIFPHRGIGREDIRPGARTMAYRKRVIIDFSVDDAAEQVMISELSTAGRTTSPRSPTPTRSDAPGLIWLRRGVRRRVAR